MASYHDTSAANATGGSTSVPAASQPQLDRGYGYGTGTGTNPSTGTADFASGNPDMSSPLSQSFANHHSNSNINSLANSRANTPSLDGNPTAATSNLNRSASSASTAYNRDTTPSRSGTLKKKASVSRKGSLRRSSSRRSTMAGSISGVGYAADGPSDGEEYTSAFYTPIPTSGSPTEILANRFQAWRTLLKSLITYFREVQSSYDHRSKALIKVANVIQNMQHPTAFITDGGLADATRVLSDYHKHSLTEANKSKDIEQDVIAALSGLRADLAQKIKEIKSLSGDFKNSVDKEKETTKKAVSTLQDALAHADHNDSGKNDPFIVKLSVDRAVERQIDEENYLHRAYLNLESSGRELESIVVGEIQKAYNALAGILKREGDDAYNAVEQLRTGPIAMPKDLEWNKFVENDPAFVNPKLPLRRIQDITYPGKDDPAASEIRAGMLERKSKYLKSYTPGWYVLSPTHLHEFKSADKIYSQPPVMSLYLPDQKLGSHSSPDSSSHKFMLKGRQSGAMHRGHSWVFRAESYDTMMAWFDAIKMLTEKTGAERDAFVRQHVRSLSTHSHRPASISSDGLEEDEADQVPYSAASSVVNQPIGETKPQRPLPGGRFPSDLNVNRDREISPSSSEDRETIATVTAMPGAGAPFPNQTDDRKYEADPYRLEGIATHTNAPQAVSQLERDRKQENEDKMPVTSPARTPAASQFETNPVDRSNGQPSFQDSPYPRVSSFHQQPVQTQTFAMPMQTQQQPLKQVQFTQASPLDQQPRKHSTYGDWLAPAAAGAGAGALGAAAYNKHKDGQDDGEAGVNLADRDEPLSNPTTGNAVPIATTTNTIAHTQPNAFPTYPEPQTYSNPGQQPLYDGSEASGLETPRVTSAAALPTMTTGSAKAGAYNDNRGISGETTNVPTPASSAAPISASAFGSTNAGSTTIPYQDERLGGHEGKGARQTGSFFPAVVRHNTDMSVSQLHVPGEFPTAGSRPDAPSTNSTGEFIKPSQWDLVRE